ncbi:hypothetical protein IFO70_29790 [Phormidium tenue FACHB-886]|nr:hypothetical protein [Phormidium tenue FACHB-886]
MLSVGSPDRTGLSVEVLPALAYSAQPIQRTLLPEGLKPLAEWASLSLGQIARDA